MAAGSFQEPSVLILHLALDPTVSESKCLLPLGESDFVRLPPGKAGIGKSRGGQGFLSGPSWRGIRASGLPSALPRSMNPGSEYSARLPGFRLKWQFEAGAIKCGGGCDVAKNST